MTGQIIVIKRYESFVLGICKCGCNTKIPIRNTRKILGQYKNHHLQKIRSLNWKGGITSQHGYEFIWFDGKYQRS